MYGKLFESTFTGSLVGSGPDVFAVWAYVIAHAKPPGEVELNPKLLAMVLGASEASVRVAIDKLCAPDEASRSKDEGGCRLVKTGEYLYRVPTWSKYRSIKNDEERREYNRIKKRESRARQGHVTRDVNDSQRLSAKSAQAEADAEAESEAEAKKKRLPRSASAEAPSSPTRILTDAFNESYERRFKSKYAFVGKRDGKIVQDILGLAGGDPEAVLARLRFAEADSYHADRLRDWPYFLGAWNKLVPAHAPTVGRVNGKPWDERRALERLRSDDPRIVKLGADELRAHGIDPDSYRPAVAQ